MTITHDRVAPVVTPAVADGCAVLLPGRVALLTELAGRLADPARRPGALLVVGLLRRDDTWPTPASALDATTRLVAASLRGDDWIGRSGPTEFAVLVEGSAADADTVAARLTAEVGALGFPGLGAGAGIAVLEDGVGAAETLRRATLSLTTARSAGAGSVIRYRGVR
jgi:GGDEF domain-containing protein